MSSKKDTENIFYGHGDRLRSAIKKIGITQKTLSEQTGMSRAMINSMCNNARPIKRSFILLMEKIHRVNPNYILGKSEDVFLTKQEEGISEKSLQSESCQSGDLRKTIRTLDILVDELRSDKKSLNETIKKLFHELEIKNKQIEDLKKEVVALTGKQTPAVQ